MAADLTFTSTLNDAGFKAGLDRMLGTATAMSGRISGVLAGAFSVTAIAMFGKSLTDMAGDIKDTSMALGMSTDALQGQQAALAQAGISAEQYRTGMGKLLDAQQALIANDPKIRAAFEALGLSFEEVANTPVDELLLRMADGFQNADSHGKAFAATMDIMGKGGNRFASALAGGREEIEKFAAAADKLTPDAVNALEKAGDNAAEAFRRLKVAAGDTLYKIMEGWDAIGAGIQRALGGDIERTDGWQEAGKLPDYLKRPSDAATDPQAAKDYAKREMDLLKAKKSEADERLKQADKKLEAADEKQRQYDFASPDERRQMRRDEADTSREERRRDRIRKSQTVRDTRPGSRERRREMEDATKEQYNAAKDAKNAEVELSAASIQSLATAFGAEVDKVIVRP